MGFIGPIIVDILFIIVLAVAGGFITKATAGMKLDPKDNKEDYDKARKYMIIISSITWLAVALIIAVIVLYCIFGIETAEETGNVFLKAMAFLIIASVSTEIVFTVLSLRYQISGNIRTTNPQVFQETIISLSISGGFLLGYIIWSLIRHHKEKEQN